MTFWSDVEREYNELLGDAPSGGNDDDNDVNSSAGEFNDLLSNIKKDVKKIPKSEVFPSFSPNKTEEDLGGDESDLEQEDGRRNFTGKSKTNKKCIIGGQSYEVGARWKDEKTGKDMMCILMNIPKNVQPLLADVDILSSKPNAENDTEWKRPSVEPQWSYTATPIKKDQCQEVYSGKPSEKPDKIESSYDAAEKSESNKDQRKEPDPENNQIGNEEESDETSKEINESGSKIQTELTDSEPKIIVVDPPESIKEDVPNEDEDKSEKVISKSTPDVTEDKEIEAIKEEDKEESDESSYSEIEQDNKISKSDMNDKSKKTDEITKENYTNSPENEISTKTKDTSPDITEDPQHIEKDSNGTDQSANSDESNIQENSKTNNQGISGSKDNVTTEEKGEPIYTKETVVVQRKLIKTEKTIETTEIEKNKK